MQSLWMLVATFLFSITAVCVKLAGDHYSTAEIVLCRGIVGTSFICGLIGIKGGTLKTAYPRDHIIRSGIGVTAMWIWFYSFSLLPVATSTTLNYMSSIWIAAILFGMAWWQGKKRFEWGLAGTVLLSFVGVALLLRPSVSSKELFGGIIALFSSVLSALAYLQVRRLGLLGEPDYRVVFYFSFTGLLAGIVGSITTGCVPFWHAHSVQGVAFILTIGLTTTLAQIAMTRAYRLGNTLVTANLQYTGIVFTSMWGMLIWKDAPDWLGFSGIAIILISGIASTFYQQRAPQISRNPPVTDTVATEKYRNAP